MEPKQQEHKRVTTYTETVNVDTTSWKLEFNQATFINYDVNAQVNVNSDIVIPPALTDPVTGFVYPTFLEISLHVGEVNDQNFNFTFNGSTTANLVIVHTEYNEGL